MKKDRGLKILSFNWHEPYLCMMAGTGHEFIVVEPQIAPGQARKWDFRMRPLPENVRLASTEEMEDIQIAGGIDLIICHNIKDLASAAGWDKTPKIMVFHNKLTTELLLGGKDANDRDEFRKIFSPYLEECELVFISESKKSDWDLGRGRVILPGIDMADYGGYAGDLKTVLRVGNLLRERDLMLGFSEQEASCVGLPTTILGQNPTIPGSRLSNGWDDLRMHYRRCRAYLHTTKEPYEDGYNLALLEAMATGMPILTLENATSPITDGVEGYASSDPEVLREQAQVLLDDQPKAKELGEAARAAVGEKFPIENYLESWKGVIAEAVSSGKRVKNRPTMVPSGNGVSASLKIPAVEKGVRIWLDYAYYPATTAHYIRRAIRKPNSVITSGSSITPAVIKQWNLEKMKADILPQDIPRSVAPDAGSIYGKIMESGKPDFFLWIDTGLEGPPPGIENLPLTKAAYLIDSHINLEKHLEIAKSFDVVFLAQRAYIDDFKKVGVPHVYWLPLACDPEVHGRKKTKTLHDIGFVGSMTAAHSRRKELLGELSGKCGGVAVERLFLEDMARHFSASRIVFNNAIKNDLNMRVFEVLASGAMLLTDDADGLTDFFKNGEHLVIYEDSTIAETAKRYLENEKERKMIAKNGMQEVLDKHTYGHRVDELIGRIMEHIAEPDRVEKHKDAGKNADRQYYRNVRPEVAGLVPETAMKILEIGCAAGETGKFLKEQNRDREVVGMEYDPSAAREAEKVLDRVFTGDVERVKLPYPAGYFDCIIYADVLEHLKEPEKALKRHLNHLAADGVVIMSIPNVQHYSLVNSLLEGKWTYRDEGLLDRTHLRFYTQHEIEELLKRAGLTNFHVEAKHVDDLYKEGSDGTLRIGRWQIDNLTKEEMKRFFAYQYIVFAKRGLNMSGEARYPWHPSRFQQILHNDKRFRDEKDNLFQAGARLLAGEKKECIELLDHLKEESDPERLLLIGHINMALGFFNSAESVYMNAGAPGFAGLAKAGRGLLYEAVKGWHKSPGDEYSMELLDKYSIGASNPDLMSLRPVSDGVGAFLWPGDSLKTEGDEKLDYIASCHSLRDEGDIAGTLTRWRDSLKTGGIIGLVVAEIGMKPDEQFPPPANRFTKEGIKNLVSLIEGLEVTDTEDIMEGSSFIAVIQKGGGGFSYEKALNRQLAEEAALLANGYWSEGLREAAYECAKEAHSLDPENIDALVRLGDSFQNFGRPVEAETYYKKAAELGDRLTSQIGMGTLELAKSLFPSAMIYFRTALDEDPNNDKALCGFGMALFHSGEQEEGFAYYKRALEINPENIPAVTSILQGSYILGRLEEAESALSNYIELHPANIDILFGLAGVYYSRKKFQEAEDILDRILVLEPGHADSIALVQKVKEERV